MIIYGGILLAVAVVFCVLAIRIYNGKTELIHDYHRTKVTDKTAYGKAFGKALGVIAGAMAASGVVGLFGQVFAWLAVGILLTGLAVGIFFLVRVQKKYNGGVF